MKANDKITKEQLMKFSALFGPPPVLSTESLEHYNQMWECLLERLVPRDFFELMLIRQILDESWKIRRYVSHQGIGIERRFRRSLEFQTQRKQERKIRREALAKELAERSGRPISEFERLIDLENDIEASVADVDNIAQCTASEISHNEALEAGIEFQGNLDRLINAALARRNNLLEQLEFYRESLGHDMRRISDEIIDATSADIGPSAKQGGRSG